MTGCRSGQAQQWWHISMLFGFIFLLPVTTPSLPVRTHPVFLIETIIHRQGICKEKHNRKAHSSHSFFSKTPKSVLLLKLPSMHTPTCLKEIYPPCPRENQYILILKRISRGEKKYDFNLLQSSNILYFDFMNHVSLGKATHSQELDLLHEDKSKSRHFCKVWSMLSLRFSVLVRTMWPNHWGIYICPVGMW